MPRSKLVRAAAVVFVLAALVAAAPAQGRDLLTVEFFSPAVDRTMKYNILLPDDYGRRPRAIRRCTCCTA